jgi:hypothetical protein
MYVDGFNLYYAISDLKEPFLKWVDLWKLGNVIIPSRSEELVRVVFCSAYTGAHGKQVRHERYVKALEVVGVTPLMGHYVGEPLACHSCEHEWVKSTEKQTDVNVALSLYDDAYQDVFDHAYLVTADSDQAATARMFKNRFPEKRLTAVCPPGRGHSQHILEHATAKITLTKDHLEKAVLPGLVTAPGKAAVLRPPEYDPPGWWVHPDQRPP